MKKIRFVSNRPWLHERSASRPGPIGATLPDRRRSADLPAVPSVTGRPAASPDIADKIPASPVLDVMACGFTYKTPCDIEFFVDSAGEIQGRVLDTQHRDVLMDRVPLSHFPHPQGHHRKHFAWWPDWAVELPEGYSALYTSPLNRFELPFLTLSGIVDNDKVVLPGTMPFFFLEGVRGVLPAGTPYAQIIPFRREHWDSEIGQPGAGGDPSARRHRRTNGPDAPIETRKIGFAANRLAPEAQGTPEPEPIIKTLPDWYRKADRFAMNPETGKPWELPNGGGKIPTWKACPAVFDVMGSGYAFKTPCDIEFFEDAAGILRASVTDPQHRSFLSDSEALPLFVPPVGYHQQPLAWSFDWSVTLPEGYGALYLHPLNRFELPFLTVNGIVASDPARMPARLPFFFLKGVTGILPAGTPFVQILPFRREHWVPEFDVALTPEAIQARNQANSAKFRRPDGGVYQQEVWQRRRYR